MSRVQTAKAAKGDARTPSHARPAAKAQQNAASATTLAAAGTWQAEACPTFTSATALTAAGSTLTAATAATGEAGFLHQGLHFLGQLVALVAGGGL